MPSGALLLDCCPCRICASADWGSTADAGCLSTGHYYQWSLALQKFADVHRLVRDRKAASSFKRLCISFEDFIRTCEYFVLSRRPDVSLSERVRDILPNMCLPTELIERAPHILWRRNIQVDHDDCRTLWLSLVDQSMSLCECPLSHNADDLSSEDRRLDLILMPSS